jgi:HEAT repeat protein
MIDTISNAQTINQAANKYDPVNEPDTAIPDDIRRMVIDGLKSIDPYELTAAAGAAGRLGMIETLKDLKRIAQQGGDESIEAVRSLGYLRAADGVQSILLAIQAKRLHAKTLWASFPFMAQTYDVLEHADSLGRIGTPDAIQALELLLKDEHVNGVTRNTVVHWLKRLAS